MLMYLAFSFRNAFLVFSESSTRRMFDIDYNANHFVCGCGYEDERRFCACEVTIKV